MSKIKLIIPAILSLLILFFAACNKNDDSPNNGRIISKVVYKSSSLATQGSFAREVNDSVPLIPYNIDGEALSLLFATASQVDEGLVVFGDMRPDIAPSNSTLYPFDFADQLAITSEINVKTGYVGGNIQHMVSTFGFINIYVEIDDVDRALRLALSDYNIGSDTYLRGDVLLQDTVTEIFRFYDLTNSLFTEARPGNPYVIEEIRDFVDPIRPNMVFYPLNVFLDSNLYFDPVLIITSDSIDIVVDFYVDNFVILQDQTSTVGISDSAIINSFDITQNVVGFGNSGLTAHATFELIP